MPRFRVATVVALLDERPGLQRLSVIRERADVPEQAYAVTAVTGPVEVGHEVLLNITAVDRGLGTGGWHVVVANLTTPEWAQTGPGHVMKLRYTGAQLDTGVEEECAQAESGSDAYGASLAGRPVVAGGWQPSHAHAECQPGHRARHGHRLPRRRQLLLPRL